MGMSNRIHAGMTHEQTDAPPIQPLEERVREALSNPDGMATEGFLGVICDIIPELRSSITSKYLEGKIQKIRDAQDEAEQRSMCGALTPYLNWYLQGL